VLSASSATAPRARGRLSVQTRDGRVRAAIVLCGLAVIYLLTRFALIGRLPYFTDEATHAQFAYRGAHSVHDLFISLSIGKEPLMIWLAVVWVKLGFGPLTAVRIASLISGLLTIPVVGLLGWRIGGYWVGIIAAALCVVVPFFVVHDVIGIMEPLLTLLTAAALYVQISLAQRPRMSLGVALGLVLAAILLTKESGEVAVALVPISLLCFDWRGEGRRVRLRTWAFSVMLAGALTAGAELLLRSSSYYGQLATVRRSSFLYPVHSWHDALAHPLAWWNVAWPIYRAALSGYVGIPLLCAAAFGVVLMWRADPRLTLLLLGWIALPFAAAVLFPVSPYARHVMYLVPPLLVFAAYTIVSGWRWTAAALGRARAGPAVATGVVLLLVGISVRLDARILRDPVTATYPGRDDVQYVTGPPGGSPWPTVAALLRQRAAGVRVIIVLDRAIPNVVQLLLGDDQRYVFVYGSSPLAQRAQFVLQDGGFPSLAADRLLATGGFRVIRRLPRPRGGAVVTLYERSSGV
jgi:4-amino-4-deoxy-L-arabinose transferase-like glycosyltransferase